MEAAITSWVVAYMKSGASVLKERITDFIQKLTAEDVGAVVAGAIGAARLARLAADESGSDDDDDEPASCVRPLARRRTRLFDWEVLSPLTAVGSGQNGGSNYA